MASRKFYKLLHENGFREFNPPLSSMFDTSNKRFFQKKIIHGDVEDYDVYLDVYVYDAIIYKNGNVSPGFIQFTASVKMFGSESSSSKITIHFQESSDINKTIKLVIEYAHTIHLFNGSR